MILFTLLKSEQGSASQIIIMMSLMIFVFYFFMIRPQRKKQKEEKEFQINLKKGDQIVTISGIHGKILEINTDSVIIETFSGKIKFERTAISKDLSINRYSFTKENITTSEI